MSGVQLSLTFMNFAKYGYQTMDIRVRVCKYQKKTGFNKYNVYEIETAYKVKDLPPSRAMATKIVHIYKLLLNIYVKCMPSYMNGKSFLGELCYLAL